MARARVAVRVPVPGLGSGPGIARARTPCPKRYSCLTTVWLLTKWRLSFSLWLLERRFLIQGFVTKRCALRRAAASTLRKPPHALALLTARAFSRSPAAKQAKPPLQSKSLRSRANAD